VAGGSGGGGNGEVHQHGVQDGTANLEAVAEVVHNTLVLSLTEKAEQVAQGHQLLKKLLVINGTSSCLGFKISISEQ
jgi:hypothetical protein